MGQQFPYMQQAPYGKQGQTQGNGLPVNLPQFPPLNLPGTISGAIPGNTSGISPQQQSMLQQMLANPNAGDTFNPAGNPMPPSVNPNEAMGLPAPPDLAIGALTGVGAATLLEAGFNGKDQSAILRAAHQIDSLPGVRHVSHWLDRTLGNSKMGQQFLTRLELTPEKLEFDKVSKFIEGRQKELPKKLQQQLKQHLKDGKANSGAIRQLLDKLIDEKKLPSKQLKIVRGLRNQIAGIQDNLIPIYREQHQLLRSLSIHAQKQAVAKLQPQLSQHLSKSMLQKVTGATSVQQIEQLLGKELLAKKPALNAALQAAKKQNTGLIGRTVATLTNNIRRIFSGDTMKNGLYLGGKKAVETTTKKTLWQTIKSKGSKLLGPVLAGGFIFGQSVSKARKAEPGEKIKSFFHDFLGFGIANFVGWEVGRKVLRQSGIIEKLLPFAKKAVFKSLPLLKGLKWTWGGLIIEAVSMFVVAGMFQKVGEKIAHALFGTPKNLDDKRSGKKLSDLATTQQQALDRQNQRFSPFQKQAQTAAQSFSLTPEQIAQSSIRNTHDQIANTVIAEDRSRWSQNPMLPQQQH